LQEYKLALTSLLDQQTEELDDLALANLKMNAIAKVSWLRVNNGQDALSLLLSSERTYAEMIDWLKYGEPEQLCFRVWENELTMDNEFRLFIHAGELVAISQYDHYSYYPHLQNIKDKLEAGLRELWLRVHPHVCEPNSSYIIDIAFLPSSDKFVVVELNPFSPCTGAALFSWSADKDVLEGRSSFQFRLKSFDHLHPQLHEIVELNWDMRWAEPVKPYSDYFQASRTNPSSFYQRVLNYWIGSDRVVIKLEQPAPSAKLFVYGTLKRGFQWNGKYLASRLGGKFISVARTKERYAMVIGDSGVPYLLSSTAASSLEYKDSDLHQITGEIWSVEADTLRGLDDYEGVSKGYYQRIMIPVEDDGSMVEAYIYVLQVPSDDLRGKDTFDEYTVEMHERYYKPVRHIQRKQFAYIGKPSSWGKLQGQLHGSLEQPQS
jgi:gamma-glutamylcyclotransferase (GGCT)/AIG2-like uncharacterized protein YtfP